MECNTFIDTVRYRIDSPSITTSLFYTYLKDNGIKVFFKENDKNKIYSNECIDYIKGSANGATICKTFKNSSETIYFEFYGLKSYCNCIDKLRNSVVSLFIQFINNNKLQNNTTLVSLDIAFDFMDTHPINVSFKRKITRGKPPTISPIPQDKNYYQDATYYLYDLDYLSFYINIKYTKEHIEKLYYELFNHNLNIRNYKSYVYNTKYYYSLLKDDLHSSFFGIYLNGNFITYDYYKKIWDKLAAKIEKEEDIFDQFIGQNKDIFLNDFFDINRYIYIKDEQKNDIVTHVLYVKNDYFTSHQSCRTFINALKDDRIISIKKTQKDFQVKLYDKKNKVESKYKNTINHPLSRVEYTIGKFKTIDEITKKIHNIDIYIEDEQVLLSNDDIINCINRYKILQF